VRVPADPAVDLCLQILADAKVQGGEVYLEDHTVFSAAVADGRVERQESQDARGIGVRLFDQGRVAFSYTSDLSDGGLREAVAIAKSLLPLADPDEANCVPEADEGSTPDPETYDAALVRVEHQEKIRIARRVEESARAADPRVKRVRQCRYTDVMGRIEVANTGGLRHAWPFSRIYAAIELTAQQGDEQQSGSYAEFAIRLATLDPAHVGREAARRATQKLGAAPVSTRRTNLVLDPTVAADLLSAIAPALHADNALKGKSLLASRVGQQVGSPRVTILDDGRMSGADHSSPYDAEGVATRCTMLMEGGVLKGFLHSTYTSVRMGAAPTGNAWRSGYKSAPHISPSTLYLQPSGHSREALLMEAGDGLYITEVMGLHTIDPISGDFSVGAAGQTLKAGRLDAPVDRIAIAGNILDLLKSVAGVATDLRPMPGGGAGSSTLLTGISVSGA